MAKIAIIGAGLTGLSTAYHLEKRGFFDYTLFEKDNTVGGLCRSVQQDGFTFDYTGHLLHTSDPYFSSFITSIVGLHNLNNIVRRSFIYSNNTFTKYPYQINLYGLPTKVIVECIEGFVTRNQSKKEAKKFCDWVLKHFGAGFAKHFFFPFQQKIFSYDLNDVTSTWMGRFVPKTSLREMIEGAIKDPTNTTIGYNSQFYYPKQGGIYFWVNKLANTLKNNIYTNCAAKIIDIKNKVIEFEHGGHEPFDILVTTMPLDRLLHSLQEKSTTRFKQAAEKLVCNSIINFNLGIAEPNVSDKHWIYFPESDYPFYRIGFAHNFAKSMAPANCSSLYGEFSYIKKSARSINQRLKQSIKETKKVFNISDKQIVTEKVMQIDHAYVIYNFWREKNLSKLHKCLKEYQVYSIGRYGEWKYSSMQEAILDGKKIAEQLTVMPAKKAFYQPTTPSKDIQKEL